MAKKKKTQLKPVARGFATTSVPKKPSEENKGPAVTPPPESEPKAVEESVPSPQAKQPVTPQDVPTNPEESSLQLLVEKFQDKTEKEIARTLKSIEQDRRHADSFLRLDLDPAYIDRILNLAFEAETRGDVRSVDLPEDKALPRLAITYGLLRRLGFSEDTVEKCLKSINGIDLEEAVDWLHLHCAEEELRLLQTGDSPEPSTPMSPQTPRNPQNMFLPAIHPQTPSSSPAIGRSTSFKPLDVNAPTFIPGAFTQSATKVGNDGQAMPDDTDTDPLAPNSEGSLTDSRRSTSGWQSPSDDLISQFVRLKMQITNLTSQRRKPGEKKDAGFLKDLQRRLEQVKADYLFDEDEAEEQFRIEREKADDVVLQARLRGSELPSPQSPAQPRSRQPSPNPQSARNATDSTDVFDNDDDESPAGLFGILEEMPNEEISDQGAIIEVRDMPLPKHWSGRTPKTLLDETIHKVDRYAVIAYRCVSGASRAKRAAVLIRWDGGRTREWSMDDIACHDMQQAEQYVATVALHTISFPTQEGFAPGANSATASQTSFRLLPPKHRDLWDELEKKRRISDDTLNRSIWAKLRTILEGKLSTANKTIDKSIKQPMATKHDAVPRNAVMDAEVASERITTEFQARQATTAYQDMLRQRDQLPIARYRSEITSILETSQILVLSGETGCGKSTQVPAFILEDQLSKGKHCKIYCTEPRRISAISLAQRVSRELGEPVGVVGTNNSLVGYSVRLESNITNRTRLAYVTNGIALRMLEGGTGPGGQGTAFDELTHIIIDEVHERSIESDFLLIVLKSLLQERPDLRVVLMSATVDAEKISKYFGGTPVLQVPGRTFPVDIRYLEDAIELTGWKVTGNSPYARRAWDKYNRSKQRVEWSEDTAAGDDDDDEATQENVKLEKRYSSTTLASVNLLDERVIPYDLIVRLLERVCLEDPSYAVYSSAILVFMPGMGEIRRLNDMLSEHPIFSSEDRFKVYPLHSTVSTEDQSAVFDIPPSGIRKIVIATNIAETGVTIPDITCVIDSGKHREMRFDEKRQISRLVETYVAKSNAAQRRGRAGRVQSGLCFHLFTKARHDTKMADHPDPEMMRLSLSDLALRIKIMKIKLGSSIEDVLCRALDPPLSVNIQRAIAALVEVGALTTTEEITPMGRLLSKLPTDVHLGKFLLFATLFRCLDPALTIAATLNSKSPFLSPFGLEQEADRAKASFRIDNSDFLTIHNAFASWRRACSNGVARKFCKASFLSHQNLQQIEDLRQQFLSYLVDSSFIQADHAFVRDLNRARYARGKTRFVLVPPDLDFNSSNIAIVNAALCAGLYPKILTINPSTSEMRTITNNQVASFHPSSVNFGRRARDFGVNYLCYFTLMHSKKLYAWETSPVEDVALLLLCGEPEFKLLSDNISIDRKIRFRVTPKASVALKLLRTNINSLLATQLRGKPLTEMQGLWNELAMMVLGKVKIQEPVEHQDSLTLVINR